MTMSTEQIQKFVREELLPMVKVSNSSAFRTVCEDFEALEIALATGNTSLIFAMANYISQCNGLINAYDISQRITAKLFEC